MRAAAGSVVTEPKQWIPASRRTPVSASMRRAWSWLPATTTAGMPWPISSEVA